MKNWLPIAFATLVALTPNTAPAGGSLAARVQAAREARQESKQVSETSSSATTSPSADVAVPAKSQTAKSQTATHRPSGATAESGDVSPAASSPGAAHSSIRPPASTRVTGRLNVADWLNDARSGAVATEPNGQAATTPAAPVDATPRDVSSPAAEPRSAEPALLPPSSRRTFSTPLHIGAPLQSAEAGPATDQPDTTGPDVDIMDLAEKLMELSTAEDDPAAATQQKSPGLTIDLISPHPPTTPQREAESGSERLIADGDKPGTEPSTTELPAQEPAENAAPDRTLVPETQQPSTGEEDPAVNEHELTESELEESDVEEPEVTAEESAAKEPAPKETAPERAAPAPVTPQKQFSRELLQLRDRNRSCLMYYYQKSESAAERSPWGVMHTLIAFGVDTELTAGRQQVNAIGWLCYNRPCRGLELFSFDGRYPVPQNGPGYQGHEGQFLSMLALSRVKSTFPMRVDGQELTVQDLIEYEKATCRPKSELTFKLIGLAHYLPSDARWTSKWGESWDIPRLIQEELAQPINGATCGGTHRLIGYSMAVQTRSKRGEPIDGQWLRAAKYVDAYHKYVIKLQNPDGSFSTNWFKGRDASGDVARRLQTSGHILEWLVFSLPEDELTDPRVIRAVNYLSATLLKYRGNDWEIGHRGHALRALALYNERVFGDKPGERRALLARRPR